nr:MAG TPA: ParB protein [Caudoviricetes sp.]
MKKFDFNDIKENSKIININEVSFNSWNPKNKRTKEYEKVKESVKLNGLTMPIVVREIEDENYKYEVLDGEQRLTACIDLGFDKIWIVNAGKISDIEAKSKTIWMEMSVPFDKKQLGELLGELVGEVELPYTDEEIEVMAGIDLSEDNDEEFIDETDNLEKFTIKLQKVHLERLKEEISKIKKDYEANDGLAIMIILDAYLNGKRNDNILSLIEKLNQEELESL